MDQEALTRAARAQAGAGDVLRLMESARLGADLGAWGVAGKTALMAAAASGRREAVEALLAWRPSLALDVNDAGVNALMWAVSSGATECVEALAPWSDLAALDMEGKSALDCAAIGGSVEALKALMDLGMDPGRQDPKRGATALMRAAGDRRVEAVAFLSGLPGVRARDLFGYNALDCAAHGGERACVETLWVFFPKEQERLRAADAALGADHDDLSRWIHKRICLDAAREEARELEGCCEPAKSCAKTSRM